MPPPQGAGKRRFGGRNGAARSELADWRGSRTTVNRSVKLIAHIKPQYNPPRLEWGGRPRCDTGRPGGRFINKVPPNPPHLNSYGAETTVDAIFRLP